jgi:hypothetical protein
MDVHKNYLQVAVLDEQGKVLDNSRVDNNLTKVSEFFDLIEIRTRFNLIHEREWTGDTVSNICKKYMSPGRRITNGIRDTTREEQKVNQISQEGLIISSTRR